MNDQTFSRMLMKPRRKKSSSIPLDHSLCMTVMGDGLVDSFFSYFLLDITQRVVLEIRVDNYEPGDLCATGSSGCNICGVIYKSLAESWAIERNNLPVGVDQRRIEYNMSPINNYFPLQK